MFEDIKELLGKPYFECKNGLLYNMDCEQALLKLEELGKPFLASTITSPPYNIGKEYEDVLPLEHYLNWLCQKFNDDEHSECPQRLTFQSCL